MDKRDPRHQTLASLGAKHIFETFAVSEEQALEHAWGVLELIDAKSGDPHGFSVSSFNDLIDSVCCSQLKWKNMERQKETERKRQERTDAYNKYIDMGKSIWERKW
jgi:hypothetical protein